MAGIVEVAQAAGVSTSTASRALNGTGYVSPATRERVRAAAARLGYVPASAAVSLVTGRTGLVGAIMPYANRWFFVEALEGIQAELLSHDLDLVLYDAKPGTVGRRRIFEYALARRRLDGLVAVGLEPDDDELESLLAFDVPIVSVIGDHQRTDVVAIDDASAVRRALGHLVALGHSDVAFVGGGVTGWAHVDRRRLDDYRHEMTHAGLGAFVRHIPTSVTAPGGYTGAVDLLADPQHRPTAILAVCDEVAIGCIVAARRHGLSVPGDLSIVGIDNHADAEMYGLTTVEQVPREQGIAAVRLLIDRLRDPGGPIRRHAVKGRLLLRASTSAPYV